MKLSEIQQKLKAPKNQRNNFGNYNYRNCEDILEALKPLLGDSTVIISDEIMQVGDRFYVRATALFLEGGKRENPVAVTAFARESLDKKGMDAAQITGAASSYARKYALNGLFLIDDTKDADNDNNSEQKQPVRYEVKRNVPAHDDETGGSTVKHEQIASDIEEAQRQTIKELLKVLKKPANKVVIKTLTGFDMVPNNYKAIIKKLNEEIDATDPLVEALSQ
jgi:hypothetical protein